jgi:hypothetical protein
MEAHRHRYSTARRHGRHIVDVRGAEQKRTGLKDVEALWILKGRPTDGRSGATGCRVLNAAWALIAAPGNRVLSLDLMRT